MKSASITKDYLVDTHKDAVTNIRHSRKSEMNIDAFKVIDAIEALGYTATDYSEQGYERDDQRRTGNGYYTVNFKSNQSASVGLLLIDAKDGQSSMKVFAGVWIGDRVFPLVLAEEIKHRKHDGYKVSNISERLGKNVRSTVDMVRGSLRKLRETGLTAAQATDFSRMCANVRVSHPNYRKLPDNMLFSVESACNALDCLKTCLAVYADVNWTRHHVRLTQGMYKAIIDRVS